MDAPSAEPGNSLPEKTALELAIDRCTALGDKSDTVVVTKWGKRNAARRPGRVRRQGRRSSRPVAGLRPLGRTTMTLLDIRDELAATRNLTAAVYMACDARSMPADQRAALREVSNLVRERLEDLVAAVDSLLAQRSEA